MPIFRRFNLITLHPARTGGTTLAHILGWNKSDIETKDYLIGYDNKKEVFLGTLPLRYFPKYLKHNESIDDFHKLIIVRNPYYRMISNYLKHHIHHALKTEYGKKMSEAIIIDYNKFLHESKNILNNTSLDELIKPGNNRKNHLIPQIDYIRDSNKRTNNLRIIKLNNMDKELPIFFKEDLGLNNNEIPQYFIKPFPLVMNTSKVDSQHYSLFYKTDSINNRIKNLVKENCQIIKEMYEEDFKEFDFLQNLK